MHARETLVPALLSMLLAAVAPSLANAVRDDDAEPWRHVTLAAADGLAIAADLYAPHDDPETPFIVLFHQAGWSRGEYREIAPKLNALGFNCLAVDQRSGGEVNGVVNETVQRAKKTERSTTYVDAWADLESAVRYARSNHAKGPLLIWGSSYSAALVLRFAGEYPDRIDGVLAFAPGEYFARLGKPDDWIRQSARKIADPVFITAAKSERSKWWPIWTVIEVDGKTHYQPETKGNHGSRALWEQFDDSDGYWKAVRPFLAQFTRASPAPSAAPSRGG